MEGEKDICCEYKCLLPFSTLKFFIFLCYFEFIMYVAKCKSHILTKILSASNLELILYHLFFMQMWMNVQQE